MKKQLEHHPYAALLPMMSEPEYQALKRDIESNPAGIIEPAILLDGQILDGRNRQRAAIELKIELPTKDFPKSWGDPLAYVKSKMQHRHLTESQRACVAVEFGEAMAAKPDRQNSDGTPKYLTNDDLAALFGSNRDFVSKARNLRTKASKLYRSVFDGTNPIHVADRAFRRQAKTSKLKKMADAVVITTGTDLWKVIVGDKIEELRKLKDAGTKARLIFCDPRYNIGIDYGNGAKADKIPEGEYLDWCQKWIEAAVELLTDDGSIFIMIDAPHLADFEMILRGACGSSPLHRRNVIVWPETFSQYTPTNYTPSWRPILYYTKSPTKYVWHGDSIHVPSDRQLKYGDSRANPDGKVPSNVWSDIPRMVDNDAERIPGFPTQLPERLLERIILATTEPGDLVIDPASGSGTTGRAAIRHRRRYIGIEINAKFAGLSSASLRVLQASLAEGK